MDRRHGKRRTGERGSHRHHQTAGSRKKAAGASHHTQAASSETLIPKSAHHRDPLGDEENYVHRWLAQTTEELPGSISHSKDRDTTLPSHNPRAGRPLFPQFLETKSYDPQRLGNNGSQETTHRKTTGLELSSGSSFLERGEVPKVKTAIMHGAKGDDSGDQEPISHRDKRKRKRSPTPSTEVRSTTRERPKETFERRARHKTKEDRYEPKKRTEKPEKERKSKPKKAKKGDLQKMAKRAGENLMHNFESKHIGNDRLTMRPAQKLGLFKHGRASSPTRRRGLPDLAFSEMEFLRRSNHKIDRTEKPPPKSRKNDRRREERTFNEISSYFTAAKEPLSEIAVNRQEFYSPPAKGHPDEMYEPRQMTDWNRGDNFNRQSSVPDATDFLEKPFLGFGRPASIADKCRVPEMRTSRREVLRTADTASMVSVPVTTYATWSESVRSPIHPARAQRRTEPERSSTPESVRQAIARTGVFRDTGLQRYASLSATEEIKGRLRKLQEDAERSSQSESLAHRIASPNSIREIQMTDHTQGIDLSRFKADIPERTDEFPRESVKRTKTKRTPPTLEIHHYDPKLGWHQGSPDEGQANVQHSTNDAAPVELVRPNRTELAKNAYFRPPTKTASREPDARGVRNETSGNMAVVEPPKIVRPATAPPKTSLPTILRPYSAAAASGPEVLRSTTVVGQEELRDDPSQISQSCWPSQELHDRDAQTHSLLPLTGAISGPSIRRTGSRQNTQNVNAQANERLSIFQDQLLQEPPVENSGTFRYPIRGAWAEQNFDPPQNLRFSPTIITGSLYGQQLERENRNDLENVLLTPTFYENLNSDDINYAREEEFIQGLSHGGQNISGYSEFRDAAPVSNLDFAVYEDNGEYNEQQRPYDEQFGNRFQPYDYQRQDDFMENEENNFTMNEDYGQVGYGAGSYMDESLFRRDVVDEQAEEEGSLARFWRPHRHY